MRLILFGADARVQVMLNERMNHARNVGRGAHADNSRKLPQKKVLTPCGGAGHPLPLNHLIYLSSLNAPSRLWPVKEAVESVRAVAADSEFLTRSEVSRMLGVSPNTVTRWAREGRLSCHVTLGGHHRFERELVEQLRKSLSRAGSRLD